MIQPLLKSMTILSPAGTIAVPFTRSSDAVIGTMFASVPLVVSESYPTITMSQLLPAEIVEKMLEGRMRKFYEEICLLEQIFVMDGETKISKLLENAAKDVGAPVALTGYSRIQLGEGIEKEEVDFAAEVAATARSA